MQVRTTMRILTLTVCLLTLFTPGTASADATKIGTVNFQKIFDNSAGGQAVKDLVNAEGQRLEKDLQQRAEEIKAMEERLSRDTGVMSKQARDEQRWELERRVDDLNTLKRNYERRIQDLQVRLVNEVRQDVLQLLQAHAQKMGYALIVEDVGVVYAASHLDLTDTILKLYNDFYAKKNSKR